MQLRQKRTIVKGPRTEQQLDAVTIDVQLRQVPYPYRAMLAICSDLDGTPDRHVYMEIMRFLNTTETTPLGQGVGLEVGNSIHFRAIPPQFSYWDTDNVGRAMIQELIHSGHIDCLHSFGERVFTRDEAERALNELERNDCRLEVWVDHGDAVTNFGSDITVEGHGDEVGHPAYHADLTTHYGIKYVCRGRLTSITGQDVLANLGGIFNWRHPIKSGRTLFKEAAKRQLAHMGNCKYAMHGPNETLRPIVLRDGKHIYEFMRCNPHWRGVGSGAQGRYIGDVLTKDMLNRLVRRGGTCVLYTHLGIIDDAQVPFNQKAVDAFRRLAEEFYSGKILVTTTRRLLGYRRAVREIHFDTQWDGRILRIDLNTRTPKNWVDKLGMRDLSGLTFYVPDHRKIRMTIDGREVRNLQANPSDHTGRPSVSLPWPLLKFPGA
jgi:hypothetical protein